MLLATQSLLVALALTSAHGSDDGKRQNGWEEISRSPELVVYARHRAGSAVNEMWATGVVKAPAAELERIIGDVEGYTSLIPYTTISRVIGAEGDATIVLQRSQGPITQPREYVIAVRDASSTTPDGRTKFELSFRAAQPQQSARHVNADAVRIDQMEGAWLVEELAPDRARVTFRLFVDPKGSIPPALVNFSQGASAEQVFASLKKLAAEQQQLRSARAPTATAAVAVSR